MRRVLATVAFCGSVRALLAPLAYTSKPLRPLPVKQVCIAPEKPEDDPTGWHDEIRRRAARCSVGYRKGTATVVFASEPSREDLAVLCGDDGTVRPLEVTELEPGDSNDWPVYKSLLRSELCSHLPPGVEKGGKDSLWVPLDETPHRVLDPPCELELGISVQFTRCVDKEGACRLLLNPKLTSKIQSTESVCSMLERVSLEDLAGHPVKSVGYPEWRGTLCKPKQPGTISDAYLEDGQSLLEYHEAKGGIRRKRLAAEADPDAETVGLRTSRGRIFDFPPQILDPVFQVEDLPGSAQNKMKFGPDVWMNKMTKTFRNLVKEWRPWSFPKEKSFLGEEVLRKGDVLAYGRLPCAVGTTPRDLSLGPELPSASDAQVIPVYRATPGATAKVTEEASKLDRQFKIWKSSISLAPRDKWIEFDTEEFMQDQLRKLNEESRDYAVLACFSDTEDKKMIQDIAAGLDLVSQGVDLTNPSKWKSRNIALGLNAKLGGQAELCRDLAEPGTIFVAYDVSSQDGIELSVGVTLTGHDGTMISGPQDSRYQKGEALNSKFLEKSLLQSVKMYERQYRTPVRRVVVNRDGRFRKDERQVCLETLSSYKVDLVEITKSGPDRLRFIEFDKNTSTSSQPLPGSYVTLRERVACLVTASAETVRMGLAQPIVVSHVHGDATFDDILAEVYKSAAIRPYSDRHTRLPAHSHYADRRAGAELAGAKYPGRPGLHAA